MKIHYEKAADHLTITFREENRFHHDVIAEDGKMCLTFGPDGALTEIEICEASKNGNLVLSYCNLPIGQENKETVEEAA